jgi:SAM-dependent methyltransferase
VDLYDAARPGYPPDAIQYALPARVGRLLDIGAGSGKLTAAVVPLADHVLAIDPSAEMLARLRERLPGVATRTGTAEDTGLADASCDAAVSGAAFHWFRRPEADAELARILRPGAPLALLWNPIDPSHPVQDVFRTARTQAGLDADEFDPSVTLDPGWFGPTRRREFTVSHALTVEAVLDQLRSRSYLLSASAEQRSQLLGDARRTLDSLSEDNAITVCYRTTVLRALRR